MMGKGEAFVVFDASGSTDADGSIETYEWDFGDGNSATETEASVTYGYGEAGSYTATLTVTDNCGAMDEVTVEVTIVGPTPPADPNNGSDDSDSGDQGSTTPPPAPIAGTQGFCYRVQRGDTLYGIAGRFGVFWPDLARVNNVDPGYYVIAGQGLFVPTGEISQPPNLYEVQTGDTLNSIAYQCGLSVMALAQANSMAADDTLTPGYMMVIPPWRY
jgi:LysM repeat protein